MQITTTARHCDLDPGVRAFAVERLEKFQRFASDIHEAHLVVTLEKYRHVAEITLRVNQHEMVSREESNDSRAAIDLAADRLEHQLRKLKDRRAERHRAGPTAEERARIDDASATPDADDDSDGED